MLSSSSWLAGAYLATAAIASLSLPQTRALGADGNRPTTLKTARSGANAVPVVLAQVATSSTPSQQPIAPNATRFAAQTPAEKSEPQEPEYRTRVAKAVAEELDTLVSIDLQTTLDLLADELTAQLGVPVLVNARAVEQADLDPSQTTVTFKSDHQPLRSALRKTLQPLGLRAEVQDEGLAITADFTELTRRGILTDKWVGMSDEFIARVDKVLATEVELPQGEISLDRVLAEFSSVVDFPMVIDRTALEGIGLSVDVPVWGKTLSRNPEQAKGWDGRLFSEALVPDPDQGVSPANGETADKENSNASTLEKNSAVQKLPLGTALRFLLNDLELTYTVRDGMIAVTTKGDAETRLLPRLYFLEGTGLPRGDAGTAMSMIQTTIEPDSWEALGGVGTMAPLGYGELTRPTLVVSTTFEVHQQIADLMKSLRETHFGPDPISSGKPTVPQSFGGGVLGGGGFGGGGFVGGGINSPYGAR